MTIDWRSKGFWQPDDALDPQRIAADRQGIFDGGFTWPLLVVHRVAIEANIATMAAYCRRHGFDFAPHAKTTMAPGLLEAQMAAGAWALTVATPNQALVLRRLGVGRVLIANEVLDPVVLRWLAAEGAAGWEVYIQVDSLAGVAAAASAVASSGAAADGVIRVLVELGHAGGRTGVRSLEELATVARAAAEAPGVELAGVAGYEGQLADQAGVDAFLERLVVGVARLRSAALLPDPPVVAAGGSAWFDRVAEKLAALRGEARLVLRSGATVTHDDGFYRERTPFVRVPEEGPLAAALEIWAQVISAPEPGLVIVGMGKRDAPFDEGLPVPREIRRADGTAGPATGLRVTKLNDHHTYLTGDDDDLVPGDLIGFGLSHPCTAFDKWRDIPVVDEERRVVDVLHTYF
ncbi:amino acid deaminase [Actinoplanes italicus]|uniref:D-serine deaminase-like pyridoxal phosphate-dependent protein n=1 Tax=Actinoplanes italicus TaxID=113567 RepID=A0A2T0K5M7_9ACTN|nr:alanine racemase [Actinoplanes italicus]PRX17971.1 D-serine deaminase-like pyridoxal phosphate-dependent protein [Actinoplanes italicus]GIE33247.1 amino acid deaminase [Actinoplanes italicus]